MIEIVLFYLISAIICFILMYIWNAYAENENDKVNFVGAILVSAVPLFNCLCIIGFSLKIMASEKKLAIDYWFKHSKKDKND